jgi:hypothetical protein
MRLIGMKAIHEHFKGLIGEDKIRIWIKYHDCPIGRIDPEKGKSTLIADSEQLDEWFTRFLLLQTYPDKVVDRILAGPKQTTKKK